MRRRIRSPDSVLGSRTPGILHQTEFLRPKQLGLSYQPGPPTVEASRRFASFRCVAEVLSRHSPGSPSPNRSGPLQPLTQCPPVRSLGGVKIPKVQPCEQDSAEPRLTHFYGHPESGHGSVANAPRSGDLPTGLWEVRSRCGRKNRGCAYVAHQAPTVWEYVVVLHTTKLQHRPLSPPIGELRRTNGSERPEFRPRSWRWIRN